MIFSRRTKPPAARRRSGKQVPGWMVAIPTIPWRRLAPAGIMLLAVAGTFLALRVGLDRPVREVAISGRFQRVQPVAVEHAVRGALQGDGMVAVDLARIAAAVETIPWVDRASVARSWPKGLRVQVIEQRPVARWGEGSLVNMRGEVFVQDAQHLPPELPHLVGPDGFEAEMTERCLATQARLEQGGLRLTRMSLDERGAWDLTFDNGIALRLGREDVDERFERFLLAAASIVKARAAEIEYVDMRYGNGFAIGWRAAAKEVKRG